MAYMQGFFPSEITHQIVKLVCWQKTQAPGNPNLTRWTRTPEIAQYASVCREWQDIVEHETFQTLRLSRERLDDVDRVVCQRRRAYVRSIYLDIILEHYPKELYGHFETAQENDRNSYIFTETLRSFFHVFSRWGAPGAVHELGVSLHITAFSPSDVTHCGEAELRRRELDFGNHDIFGDRYVHSILNLVSPSVTLPVVECISELHSGKDRHVSAPAWTAIINSLPNAKKIDADFWDNEKKDLSLRRRLRDGQLNFLFYKCTK